MVVKKFEPINNLSVDNWTLAVKLCHRKGSRWNTVLLPRAR